MYEEQPKKQMLLELKELIEQAQEAEDYADAYCNLMKSMILNTYSVN